MPELPGNRCSRCQGLRHFISPAPYLDLTPPDNFNLSVPSLGFVLPTFLSLLPFLQPSCSATAHCFFSFLFFRLYPPARRSTIISAMGILRWGRYGPATTPTLRWMLS